MFLVSKDNEHSGNEKEMYNRIIAWYTNKEIGNERIIEVQNCEMSNISALLFDFLTFYSTKRWLTHGNKVFKSKSCYLSFSFFFLDTQVSDMKDTSHLIRILPR